MLSVGVGAGQWEFSRRSLRIVVAGDPGPNSDTIARLDRFASHRAPSRREVMLAVARTMRYPETLLTHEPAFVARIVEAWGYLARRQLYPFKSEGLLLRLGTSQRGQPFFVDAGAS